MKIARLFLFVVGFILLGVIGTATLVERVPPATIGVRQNLWAGGVVEKDFAMGFHLGVVGMHKWHFLDRRTHFLTFSENGADTSMGRSVPALEFRTRDNNTTSFDVTVTYRIKDDEAHLLVAEGNHTVYRQRAESAIGGILREEFAQMSSEEIYLTEERTRVSAEALPKLAAALASLHIEPKLILIRSVRFQDGYEARLQEKQLTYQKRLLAEAQKLLEDQRAITDSLSAEIEAAEKELRGDRDKELQEVRSENKLTITRVLAAADVYDQTTRSQADAEFETLIADGNLAIDKAEALRNELRNQALDTLGGRIYLAQQAAENLQFESVTLNSNDPAVPTILDISAMVKMLVGESE